jgi:hypothetical protein
MANELLDFVMSLVHDPDAAARYAADPSQAIADAHLTGVTSADVNSLIPVVTESFPTGAPAPGGDVGHDSNVWASGAATAAFDAFSADVADQIAHEGQPVSANVIEQPPDHPASVLADFPADSTIDPHTVDAASLHPSAPVGDFQDLHIDDPGHAVIDPEVADHAPGVAHHPVVDDHHFGADTPNFDIFE